MSIIMIGCVYCPLSPRDPEHRLSSLIQQTQSRLILIHWLTNMKFNNDMILMDINSIVINNKLKNDLHNIDRLSNFPFPTPPNLKAI